MFSLLLSANFCVAETSTSSLAASAATVKSTAIKTKSVQEAEAAAAPLDSYLHYKGKRAFRDIVAGKRKHFKQKCYF